ncbi:MAG: STAS/SEC14 domain-containing protein [Victivallales bacterium]|nr:STAS/SEC14 domain-containing protein [Victivallales bacterium]
MITLIPDLPDHVVGIVGSGKITDQDYRTVFIPALEAALSQHDRVNILYVLDRDYAGFTAGAMWDDTWEGLMHLRSWGRVAVVCDSAVIKDLSRAMGFLLRMPVQTYKPEELDTAKEWICGTV